MMLNLKGLVGLVCLTSLHATKLRWGIDAWVAGMNLEGGMAGEAILLGDSSRTRTLPEYDSDYSVRVESDQFGQHSKFSSQKPAVVWHVNSNNIALECHQTRRAGCAMFNLHRLPRRFKYLSLDIYLSKPLVSHSLPCLSLGRLFQRTSNVTTQKRELFLTCGVVPIFQSVSIEITVQLDIVEVPQVLCCAQLR